MKQRFSSLDVKVIAHELSNSLVSLRLSNVYDLSSRIFLLKFAKPEHREQLLIDSGFRCHLTSFARTTAAAPSAFVARLRKFLRTRRVTSVSQIGTDRVIEIQFSDGAYRLFLEFYAGGNILLTDNELNIIALLRNVNEGEEHEQYRLGLKYNLERRQNYGGVPPLTKDRVREGLQKAIDKQHEAADAPAPGKKKIRKKAGDALRKALAVSIPEFPPVLLDHALQVKGFDKDTQPSEVLGNEETLEKLMAVFDEAEKVLKDITSAETAKGYIVAKGANPADGAAQPSGPPGEGDDAKSGLMYDDFHPFKPVQLESKPENTFLEFAGFNKTVDENWNQNCKREENAKRKLDQARQEHEKRIGGLQQVQELNVRKAQAIEANLDRVEEATAAVNGLIAQGMDWVEIARLIEMEQNRHNPVAEMIKLPLKLYENTVTLLLAEYDEPDEEEMEDMTDSEPSDSEDEEAQATAARSQRNEDKRLAVDIDLGLSGWSNARGYYEQRKVAATKQEKTQQASAKALKSTEQKVMADLKKGLKQEKQVLRPVRKQFWFEKFMYFISSDGYLVLGGKDAQQNEILYRRYLKKGDIYVHADLHGAASVIIKNNPATPDAPIPPSTLSQAGNLSVCTSSAWDSKAVMSAWWVNSDQVSKTAPTGEYLTTGGFMIRGKKNFLPPAQLLLGFAVMFQITTTAAEPNGDTDDDFPDAQKDDDDDDDDFPDAKANGSEGSDDESSSEDGEEQQEAARANPLQQTSGALAAAAASITGDDEDDTAEEEVDEQTAMNSSEQTNDALSAAAAAIEPDNADETAEDGEDADEAADQTSAQRSGKRHLTARERRLQRKGKDIDAVPGGVRFVQKAQSAAPKPKQPVRGKTAKQKRAAARYAHQDEEDRQLAMQLLGSRKADEEREKQAAAAPTKEESAEQQRARRRAQHEEAQRKGLEAEEIRRLNLEEGVEELDEEESKAMTQLDALVGAPLPGDEILEAIPVCAPWGALGRYKYKAKLQPGAQKKGKAVRRS
ncbi:hypothetical protein H2203_005436 [Taxawa tesnikishii (nom. ined.)]|nr:hypothetical protein H2203_005436 [Dothideales sp. JES 119]